MTASQLTKSQIDHLVKHWHTWTEGEIGDNTQDETTRMVTHLRNLLKRRGDDRWKLLYRKRNVGLTDEHREYLLAHYSIDGQKVCAAALGMTPLKLASYMQAWRDKMTAEGDDRINRLSTRGTVHHEEIICYGVVKAPDFFACDDDPRPPWLVIDHPRFRDSQAAYNAVEDRRRRT